MDVGGGEESNVEAGGGAEEVGQLQHGAYVALCGGGEDEYVVTWRHCFIHPWQKETYILLEEMG